MFFKPLGVGVAPAFVQNIESCPDDDANRAVLLFHTHWKGSGCMNNTLH